MNYKEPLILKKNIEIMNRNFVDLVDYYQYSIVTDRYVIHKSVLTEQNLESIEKSWNEYRNSLYLSSFVVGKEYVILYDKTLKKTMMSNHEFEMLTNQKFLDNAKGDVLVFGLGIGLIIFPLLKDTEIKSITIVETDSGLIDEVFPIIIQNDTDAKVSVYMEDAFKFETDKMFDTIYFDIWSVIDQSAFSEMRLFSEKFKNNLKPNGWMDSWCSEEESFHNGSK